ncbi:hypothetical protein [Streptomyces sp. CB01881]|uniref:hypothetical protein n=1 Tax=Streptomyces sp. CB01881 TaxID=2078691 RepID=UPI000CDC2A34|nr:hypothetical protein [Streptomyces sp. CB01881]AUY48192.1 hypothetical protein C2142_03560 [Streptomyces sp. CB01881]TYC76677.1 hypothetical protein EH183_03570 [Streptomyces sp. CB01881]
MAPVRVGDGRPGGVAADGPGVVARYSRRRAALVRQGLTLVTRRRVTEELALDAAQAGLLSAHLAADPAQDAFPLWRLDAPA